VRVYRYDQIDQTLVNERVAQFRDQTRRFLAGELSEDEFRPLRLRNGLYIQRFAPMLRVSIPYGLLSSRQLRMLAHIARTYDRGYGHFTTRQNIQYNWPQLEQVPDILADLASVEMHAIQTSGNCIRNITADHLAGVAPDEIADPRPYCEIIRQWATLHPEFSYLPRKFKIAVTASPADRAAVEIHDVGVRLKRGPQRRDRIRDSGRRRPGPHADSRQGDPIVSAAGRSAGLSGGDPARLQPSRAARQHSQGAHQDPGARAGSGGIHAPGGAGVRGQSRSSPPLEAARSRAHARLLRAAAVSELDDVSPGRAVSVPASRPRCLAALQHPRHKVPGYRIVIVSLKKHGEAPGDISAEQMDALAQLADRVSFGMVRTTHDQNLVLADVPQRALHEVWRSLTRWDWRRRTSAR
jgi:sulfite reductase (NADPH) hemoprotein beta-component